MFIKISTGKEVKPVEISKKSLVKELKAVVKETFGINAEKQKLFFSGKLLDDNTPIYKYDVKDGYVVQVIVTENIQEKLEKAPSRRKIKEKEKDGEKSLCEYYSPDDWVEVQDEDGSWYEARIMEIFQECGDKENQRAENKQEDEGLPELRYKVTYQKQKEDKVKTLTLADFRPRSVKSIDMNTLKIRQTIHVNYNLEDPEAWGSWYDLYVVEIERRKKPAVIGRIVLGKDEVREDVRIDLASYEGAVFTIQSHTKREERPKDFETGSKPIWCDKCSRDRTMRCRNCGCCVCGSRVDPEKTIMCDECQSGYHMYCLKPALKEIPEVDDWYCPECKNEDDIVKAGQTVKTKRGEVADSSKSQRDWGRGMATAGCRSTNTIVPMTHFGAIPGVEVGTTWRYRIQVAESGVHRPPVAGIAGRQDVGAFSIVLAGGYEDDKDDGEEVLYTGSGGRDLSGNKRCSGQSCDQELTRMNRALAKNCNVSINTTIGAEATNWKGGKAVRVVRSYKEKSEYAPDEGFRYDGLYKIVKYFPKTGKSGFKVWQFLMRRDDATPAPWTKEGKKHIEKHGLEAVIYPENYAGDKRKTEEDDPAPKRQKVAAFQLGELADDVNADELNAAKWLEVKEILPKGKIRFLEELQKVFECICCQNLACKPVTTTCKHTFCKVCLQSARRVMGDVCPLCKSEIGKESKVNEHLNKVLLELYPGYDSGR